MSEISYTFKNTGEIEFNDVVYPGNPFQLDGFKYCFSVSPKTQYWRFGIRFSKTEKIEFFHPNGRYNEHEFKKYKDIHLGAGERVNNRWGHSHRLNLMQYNFAGNRNLLARNNDYQEFSQLNFTIDSNENKSTLSLSIESPYVSLLKNIELDYEYKYFKIFAWADSIDFELGCKINILKLLKEELKFDEVFAIESGNIQFRFGDMFDKDIIDKSSIVFLPVSSYGTVASGIQNELVNRNLPPPKPEKPGRIYIPTIGKRNQEVRPVFGFAYSVENDNSNEKIIENICVKITKQQNKSLFSNEGKVINLPLLGTGSGKLDPIKVLEIYDKHFNEIGQTKKVLISIPRSNIFDKAVAYFLGRSKIISKDLEVARNLIISCKTKSSLSIDLGKCGLNHFDDIKGLFECVHLETLILSNEWAEFESGKVKHMQSNNEGPDNFFESIPEEFAKLKNLKKLVLGGNWVSKKLRPIPWRIENVEHLRDLVNLEYLNLSNNQIKNMDFIIGFKKLKKLHLNNNLISDLPDLNGLHYLEELYLSNNRIKIIKFLKGLRNINTVDLHSNLINDISDIIPLIKKIGIENSRWKNGTINIENNPLEIISSEIIEQGKNMVLAHFERKKSEEKFRLPQYTNNDIKVILVGNSNVGKSTLSKWITEKIVDLHQPTSHWLSIKEYTKEVGELHLRIFDFGGQDYYHDTHHLFFTNSAIYLALWDKETNVLDEVTIDQIQDNLEVKTVKTQAYPLNYWLDSIVFHTARKNISENESVLRKILAARDSKLSDLENNDLLSIVNDTNKAVESVLANSSNIIIIQSKTDSPSHKEFINEKKFKENYGAIYDFCDISVQSGRGVSNLEDILSSAIKALPIKGRKLIGSWGKIKSYIEKNLAELPDEMSIVSFRDMCNEIISKLDELKNLSKSTVKTLLFSESDAKSLAQYLNVIGLILYYPESPQIELKNKVFLNQKSVLGKIYDILLGLQDKGGEFDRGYVSGILPKCDEQDIDTLLNLMRHFKIIFNHPCYDNSFIAPLYLPKKPVGAIQLFFEAFQKPNIRFEYEGFIHKSVILDFFQEFGKDVYFDDDDTKLFYYWKDGIVLKDKNSEEVILVQFFNGTKIGNARIDLFKLNNSSSSSFFEKIVQKVDEINLHHKCIKLVTIDGIVFIPLKKILENEEKGNWIFKYGELYFNLIDFRKYLINDIKMKNIFISYSKADTAHLKQLENHLSLLKRNGTIATWTCQELLPGVKWDGKIKSELEKADIIIFLVSSDFLATDYIWDVEIRKALERDADEHDKMCIVPIIIRDCDWQDSPLGVFNTAPKKAQVINSSDNIDEAWTKVVKELKRII